MQTNFKNMPVPTIDQKIEWVKEHIDKFNMALAETDDQELIELYKYQINFFYAILDDLYSIRLWQHLHNTEDFDIYVLPMMMN